ncbi:alpha/beta fold hydrolase [Treponema sp.]|uniref:alpha/beta fold hydrolase n=1 Tax=Treponema sp. TaxID=166 RepID=UPI00388EC3F6
MKYENFQFKMSDGKCNVIHQWTSEVEPDFVVVLSHGMAEHALRYEELASFICENNGAVIIEDHRGHGKTAELNNLPLGNPGNATFKRCAEDIHEEIIYAKEHFPGTKIILIGHSFGSFLAQYVIENYGREIDKAILLGTAGPRPLLISGARFLGFIIKLFFGRDHVSKLLHNLTFKPYNAIFKDAKTDSDWLSSDPLSVDIFKMDRMCGFICSTGFMYNLFALLNNIHKPRNLNKISRELPVKIMSGTDDPVGSCGKTISRLAAIYCGMGIKDVSLKLYNGARHELLNDRCRYDVINEIIAFCRK